MQLTHVTLQDILAARDKRAAKQKLLLEKYQSTIISLTVIAPGSVKRTPDYLFVAETADKVISSSFDILYREFTDSPTGYEALYVTNTDAESAKKIALDIENTHPLGRLMDIDIVDAQGKPMTRVNEGKEARLCLICSQPAAYCIRAKSHTEKELLDAISNIIKEYRKNNGI